jgi:predicted acyl esterase
VGAWSDLMLDRDASIIYSRGANDDGANLVIGPWTDSSFGYKQDGAGRHGFNTSNPRHVLDANGTANISGSLLVGAMNVVPTIQVTFGQANTARDHANAAF